MGYGIDPDTLSSVAEHIAELHKRGVELGLVVGGGNIFRGLQGAAKGMDRITGDHMGMLATVINGLALADALNQIGVPTRLQSAVPMGDFCETFNRSRAVRHLSKKRVVIFSAGTGSPFFTTDTAASLRAVQIGAQVLLKATKVDGVYSSDPLKDKDALFYPSLTYQEVLERQLRVMDITAISLCMENQLPIIVFNLEKGQNILRVVMGEPIGTIVK